MPDLSPTPDAADELSRTRAAEITKAVFGHLNITKVFFVDDHARPPADVNGDDISSAILDGRLDPAALAAAVPALLGVVADEGGTAYDMDTAAGALQSWWADADEAATQKVLAAYHDQTSEGDAGAKTNTDAAAVSMLEEIVPKGVVFKAVFPSEWQDVVAGGKLVGRKPKTADSKQPKTLVLFDRDLSDEPGFREDEGEHLLAQLLESPNGEHCFAALVSHYVDVDAETSHWTGMEQSLGLDRTRFIVISKARLSDDRIEFAHRLRGMLLAPRLAELAGRVSAAYVEAVEAARSELVNLPLPATEQAVLRCAIKEGLWEPDVLLRLLEGHVRDAVRGGIRADPRLHVLVSELRRAATIRNEPAPGDAADELRAMQRREAYSDHAYLSELRLPLEPGDILRLVPVDGTPGQWDRAQDEPYLLVTEQDCDLHIRDDGKRNRNPQRLTVVPIALAGVDSSTTFRLPWFCPATGADAFAVLNKPRGVPALALDLAAVGEHGYASFTVGAGPASVLIPTWESRHGRISNEVKGILAEYATTTAGAPDAVLGHVLMSLTLATRETEIRAAADVDASTLVFGLQRIGRLLPPWRTELFQRMSLLGQRVAYEGDFAADEG